MISLKDNIKVLFKTGFFHIFGSSTVNKVIAFISSIVLVRILSKTEYGVFTYAWNIYSIVLLFNGMGIESGTLQLASEHGGEISYSNSISRYSTQFGLKIDVLLLFVILAMGLLFPFKIESARTILSCLCVLPMIQLLFGLISVSLRAQKRNQEYANYLLLNSTLLFINSCVFSFLFRVYGLIIAYYLSFFISILYGTKRFNVSLFTREKTKEFDDKKALLHISLISMLNNGLSQLMYLLDIFVLGIIDPKETILASYKAATIIPTALSFIPLALITYLYPYFAEHQKDKEWCLRTYKRILLGFGSLNIAISAILFIFAPYIIRILFGVEYLDSITIFRLLSINYFISGTFRVLSGNLLVTQRKLTFNLIVAIITSILNIVADWFFIQWWGALGAAFATMIVVIISSILSTTYLLITFTRIPNMAS